MRSTRRTGAVLAVAAMPSSGRRRRFLPPAPCRPSPLLTARRHGSSSLGHAVERERTPVGARVRLPHDPVLAARAADLAVREVDCCGFFSFALTVEAGGVWLDVTASADDGRDASRLAVRAGLFGPMTAGA